MSAPADRARKQVWLGALGQRGGGLRAACACALRRARGRGAVGEGATLRGRGGLPAATPTPRSAQARRRGAPRGLVPAPGQQQAAPRGGLLLAPDDARAPQPAALTLGGSGTWRRWHAHACHPSSPWGGPVAFHPERAPAQGVVRPRSKGACQAPQRRPKEGEKRKCGARVPAGRVRLARAVYFPLPLWREPRVWPLSSLRPPLPSLPGLTRPVPPIDPSANIPVPLSMSRPT